MYVLIYSIFNSFSQNPAISTFFRKVHSDERKSPDSNQPSFLLPSLKEQLDPNHPIYQLNERINWSVIEEVLKMLYSRTGHPAKPVRLMLSLLLLKQLEDLSDEQVIRRWVDIPYWQYLSGETHFQWKPPAASSSPEGTL